MAETKLTFEQAMQRLEQIVRAMERGEAPLEEGLQLFREGTQLVSYCSKLLDDAQMQINKVVKSADGTPAMEAFGDEI